MDQSLTVTEQRALDLLGQGVPQEAVASAVGVSASRISQLMSQSEFAAAVIDRRFKNLAEHTKRDNKADDIESKLLDKLDGTLDMLYDPIKIAGVLVRVNALKRRGQQAAELPVGNTPVVQLNMPTQIIQQFITNGNNQVVQAGEQSLVTMQSGNMHKLVEILNGSAQPARIEGPAIGP